MKVRDATIKDLDYILDFQIGMALETENKELPRGKLRHGIMNLIEDSSKGIYFIAENESEIVGCCMITYEWSDWRNGNFWWLQSVYVLPEKRRKGIFSLMFDHIEKLGRVDEDCIGLRLYRELKNHDAATTYETLGMNNGVYDVWEKKCRK